MALPSKSEIPMTLSAFQLAARGIFPDPPANPAVSSDPIRPLPGSRQPVILIIDDDPAVLESLSRVLAGEGMTTVTAANGFEGIERLRDCMPDAVITDL